MNHIMHTYNRLPVTFSHGNGVRIVDIDGNSYMDALCGISVTNLGHSHPAINTAIKQQSEKLLHTSNLYQIAEQETLADQLCAHSGMDKIFFSNSGAEANEAAIKLARLFANNQNKGENGVILTFSGSFHGRTLATIHATANPGIREGFAPEMPGFIYGEFNNAEQLKELFTQHNIIAVLVEPVQGEGGINIATTEFLQLAQILCQQHDALFMLDEVQSGNGRTGSYFAFEQYQLQPDVVTTAKGLGNGIPIGACLAKGKAAQTLVAGKHGSTFGGNPFACRVASAVINTITEQQLCKNAEEKGAALKQLLINKLSSNLSVTEVRQKGLMIGIECDTDLSQAVQKGLENGILINVTAGNVIRLLPPLIVTTEDIEEIADKVAAVIDAV